MNQSASKSGGVASALLLMLVLLMNCKKESAVVYPTPQPSGELLSFLPGVVSTDSFEFNSLCSPDGNAFYFSREEVYNIYETKYSNGQWSTPVISSFSEPLYKECDPAFSPDGQRLFYISTRPVDTTDSTQDFNIWFVERLGENWSLPQNLSVVNSDSNEFYVSFANNGNLYFASNRTGGYGSHDIYVSKFLNGTYTTPANLGPAMNTNLMEHDPFISRDERLLIFTSVNRAGGQGRGDLFFSTRDDAGTWSEAKNLGPPFSTSDYDFCPYISPDEKFFFYSDNKDIKWIDIEQLNKVVGR